ncbi:phospholipase, partial [Flavobacteriaceae bacterium]|nr:phospholipase [Flavobacteriaceae bacterium]
MKRLCSFSFFIMIASSLYSQSYAYKYATHEEDGQRLQYRILLPEGYDMQKKYPLLLFLHGAGERGADNELQLTH